MIEHYNKRIQNVIQKELFKAESSIKIAVAWFTNELLFQPLLLKLQTGVSVELVLNKDEINNSDDNDIDFSEFVENGGILHWNDSQRLMHEKFCIIDDNVVIYGSYNWTNKAEFNDESIAVSRNEQSTVEFYSDSFEKLCDRYPAESLNNKNVQHDPFYASAETLLEVSGVEVMKNTIGDNGKELFRLYDTETNSLLTSYDYENILFHPYSEPTVVAVKKGYEWLFFDMDEKCLQSDIIYEEIRLIDHYNLYWTKQNGLWGITSEDGTIVLPCNFAYISIVDKNYIIVKRDGKYGLHDWKIFIWDCVWDSIEMMPGGVFKVKRKGKYGVIEHDNILVDCKYDELNHSADKKFIVSSEGLYGIVDGSKELVGCIYDKITEHHSWRNSQFLLKRSNKYGLIVNDTLKFDCVFDELHADCGKPSILNGKMGLLDWNGDIILEFKYSRVQQFKRFCDYPYSAYKDFYLLSIQKNGKTYYGVYLSENSNEIECSHAPHVLSYIPNCNLFEPNEDKVIESLRIAVIKTMLLMTMHPYDLSEVQKKENSYKKEIENQKRRNQELGIAEHDWAFEYLSLILSNSSSHRSTQSDQRDENLYRRATAFKNKEYQIWDQERAPLTLLALTKYNSFDIGAGCPIPEFNLNDVIELPIAPRIICEQIGNMISTFIIVKVRNKSTGTEKFIRFDPSVLLKGSRSIKNGRGTAIDFIKDCHSKDEVYSKLTEGGRKRMIVVSDVKVCQRYCSRNSEEIKTFNSYRFDLLAE